ncbi:hypothetical protein [Salinisphaera sp. T31B1]|uniref:hypothetical protein n=1 Tax=Salinisphaera sp. T31B1 TaxID=727963 RepID=UPI0033408E69
MTADNRRAPLAIAGGVLLLNSFVFLVVMFATRSTALWGPAAGCLVAGIPLLVLRRVGSKGTTGPADTRLG